MEVCVDVFRPVIVHLIVGECDEGLVVGEQWSWRKIMLKVLSEPDEPDPFGRGDRSDDLDVEVSIGACSASQRPYAEGFIAFFQRNILNGGQIFSSHRSLYAYG